MFDPVQYYRTQSTVSDPGSMAYLYDELPKDVPELCRVVQGLVYHYMSDPGATGWQIPKERLPEVDTRYAESILKRIIALDDRPLTEPREVQKRFVGCCRDFSLLFVSMARHQGIPARSRYGFGTYFIPGYYMDHVVVEVWDAAEQRWYLIDPEMSPEEIAWRKLSFDVLDIPRDVFVVGGQAWQMCRRQKADPDRADPDRFGLGPDVPVRGWEFIVGRLFLDAASLNKEEMLCWDSWSPLFGHYEPTEENNDLMDRIAALTQGDADGDGAAIEALQTLYRTEARLIIPPTIDCYSPVYPFEQLPLQVKLAYR